MIAIRCIICYRDLNNQKRTEKAKTETRKTPWLALGQSAYPLCEDYGLDHQKRKRRTPILADFR